MIDKVIHYCWFGGKPLDDPAIRCINSWKKFFPDWKIIEWNESNFDVNRIEFMKKAYEDKNWAFVSDVARLIIIYENGGIYFDTDVEVVKSYDDILDENIGLFFGLESNCSIASGLGFGAKKNHPFLKLHLDEYRKINYDNYKNHISDIACPIITTKLLENYGFYKENRKQLIDDIIIFPSEYFSPINYSTGKLKKTKLTHSIHWYNASWQDEHEKKEQEKMRKLNSIFGVKLGEIIYGILFCISEEGIIGYIKKRVLKRLRR